MRLSAFCLRIYATTLIRPVCVYVFENNACVRKKTSVARVAHVLLLRPISGNVEVNTLASKRSELIGNAAIVQKRRVIHKKSTCVCLRLPVAAIYAETQGRPVAGFRGFPVGKRRIEYLVSGAVPAFTCDFQLFALGFTPRCRASRSSKRSLHRGTASVTGVSGCRATCSRDYATGCPRWPCDGHVMAHVRGVVSVAGEAAPDVVELVDRLERLAFHDHWWKHRRVGEIVT